MRCDATVLSCQQHHFAAVGVHVHVWNNTESGEKIFRRAARPLGTAGSCLRRNSGSKRSNPGPSGRSWLCPGLAVSRRYLRVPHAPLHLSGSRKEIVSFLVPRPPGHVSCHVSSGGGCRPCLALLGNLAGPSQPLGDDGFVTLTCNILCHFRQGRARLAERISRR